MKQNQALQEQMNALKEENLQLLNTLHSPRNETPIHGNETPIHGNETPEEQLIRVTKERDDLSMFE